MKKVNVQPGDYYLDCSGRPRKCLVSDMENDHVEGHLLEPLDSSDCLVCRPSWCIERVISKEEAVNISRTGEGWGACPVCGHSQNCHDDSRGGCLWHEGCKCSISRSKAVSCDLPSY